MAGTGRYFQTKKTCFILPGAKTCFILLNTGEFLEIDDLYVNQYRYCIFSDSDANLQTFMADPEMVEPIINMALSTTHLI